MYLFIAYKPDSEDYCRGCRMAEYSSDFESANHLTAAKLAEKWAEYLYRNTQLRCNEAGYQFSIYLDGFQVYHPDYHVCWDGTEGLSSDEYYANQDEFVAREKWMLAGISAIEAHAKVLAHEIEKEKTRT